MKLVCVGVKGQSLVGVGGLPRSKTGKCSYAGHLAAGSPHHTLDAQSQSHCRQISVEKTKFHFTKRNNPSTLRIEDLLHYLGLLNKNRMATHPLEGLD